MESTILNTFPKLGEEDAQQFKTAEMFALNLCEKHMCEKHTRMKAHSNVSRVYCAITAANQINIMANKATIETWYNLSLFVFITALACYFYRPIIAGLVLVLPIMIIIAPRPLSKRELRIIWMATMFHNTRHKDFCEFVKECTADIKNWLETNVADHKAINEILLALENGDGDKYNGPFWRAYQHVRTASILEDYNSERKYQSYVQRHSSFTPIETWTAVIRDYRMEVLKHIDTIQLYYVRNYVKAKHEIAEADIHAHDVMIDRERLRVKEEAAAAAAAAAAKKAPVWD